MIGGQEITGWDSLMMRLLSGFVDEIWEVKASDLETFSWGHSLVQEYRYPT